MRVCTACRNSFGDEASFCPFDGAPLQAAGSGRARKDPLIGAVIAGRYRIAQRLGSGGFSVVYLAEHLGLGRDVALKVLHASLVESDRAVARFAREARATSRIDHENVVQVLDFGYADEGFHYLVMEHVAGTALDAEIARAAPFPAARAVHVLGQIAAGLSRAHALGVVHRDLKPENVILTQRANDRDFVKVLDFGLAKIVEPPPGEKAITRAGDVFGTPAYMAPEQWRAGKADARTDIYAIGAIAYEMLTGALPFEAAGLGELMMLHLERLPVRPRERAPEAAIGEAIDAVVMRCLAKDPAARFQTADALIEALRRVWRTLPGSNRYESHAGSFVGPLVPAGDELPDPTVYQSRQLEVVWDGPALCAEIQRLHDLRARRLAELAGAIWKDGPPRQVRDLQRTIGDLEEQVEAAGREVALFRAHLDEVVVGARQREAELRAEMVGASIDLQAARSRLPFDPTQPARVAPHRESDDGPPTLVGRGDGRAVELDDQPQTDVEDTLPHDRGDLDLRRPGTDRPPATTDPDAEYDARLRSAERRLASHQRQMLREELRAQTALADAVAHVRQLERRLAPLYEELAALVPRSAVRVPELRARMVEFSKIDGALAAYQALLEAMEMSG